MSENKTNKAVVCPMCGNLGKAEIYTSVNVVKNKKYRDSVFVDLFMKDIHAKENFLSLYNALHDSEEWEKS